tara:strand:+ start:15380 stop:15943 length:564 start_codon:yes stop_codon:yes gene_type:complete
MWPNPSKEKTFDLIEVLLRPNLQTILDRIGHFAITQLELSTAVASTHSKSEGWHFDPSPSSHYKIIFYFSADQTHDGCTQYAPENFSRSLITEGYNNIAPQLRRSSLTDTNIDPVIYSQRDQGETVLFSPATTCHRAVYPSKGARHTITLSLLASEQVDDWRLASEAVYDVSKLSGIPLYARWPNFS